MALMYLGKGGTEKTYMAKAAARRYIEKKTDEIEKLKQLIQRMQASQGLLECLLEIENERLKEHISKLWIAVGAFGVYDILLTILWFSSN